MLPQRQGDYIERTLKHSCACKTPSATHVEHSEPKRLVGIGSDWAGVRLVRVGLFSGLQDSTHIRHPPTGAQQELPRSPLFEPPWSADLELPGRHHWTRTELSTEGRQHEIPPYGHPKKRRLDTEPRFPRGMKILGLKIVLRI